MNLEEFLNDKVDVELNEEQRDKITNLWNEVERLKKIEVLQMDLISRSNISNPNGEIDATVNPNSLSNVTKLRMEKWNELNEYIESIQSMKM